MIRLLALGLLGGVSLMSSAIAETCVGVGFDVPFPGAVGVETQYADVPSAQFPGLWQQGRVDGFAYHLFANTTGVLREDQSPSAWAITVDCQNSLCIRDVNGSPPGAAWATLQRIELCLAPSVVAVPEAPPEPAVASVQPKPAQVKPVPPKPAPAKPAQAKPVATKQASGETAPAKPAQAARDLTKPAKTKPATLAPLPLAPAVPRVTAKTNEKDTIAEGRFEPKMADQCVGLQGLGKVDVSCNLASIPEADPVVTLQRLLVLAGANPGLIDGIYGYETERAILQVLGFAGRNLEVPDAILAVKAFLCLQKP